MNTLNSIGQDESAATGLAAVSEDVAETETGEDAMSLVAGLSVVQGAAFEVLTTGGTIAAAARAAHVARKTIYVWLEAGHAFATAYEQWKGSVAETSRTRLLMIGEAATVQIARSIKQGDTRTALAVAKGMGLLSPPPVAKGMGLLSPPPVGPSFTQAVAKRKAIEARKGERVEADHAAAISFKDLVDVDGFSEEMRRGARNPTVQIPNPNEDYAVDTPTIF